MVTVRKSAKDTNKRNNKREPINSYSIKKEGQYKLAYFKYIKDLYAKFKRHEEKLAELEERLKKLEGGG